MGPAMAGGHEYGGRLAPDIEFQRLVWLDFLVQAGHGHHQRSGATGKLGGLPGPRHRQQDLLRVDAAYAFLHTQGIAVVAVIILVFAKGTIAHALVQPDRVVVCLGHFETHGQAAFCRRRPLEFQQEMPADTLAACRGGHRDRVQTRQACALVQKHQPVSQHPLVFFRHQEYAVAGPEPMLETAPAEPVRAETVLFQPHQVFEIPLFGWPDDEFTALIFADALR